MISPPIAGVMIDWLEPVSKDVGVSHLGYKSIFVLSSVLLLLAVVFVKMIKVGSAAVVVVGHPPTPQLEADSVGQEMVAMRNINDDDDNSVHHHHRHHQEDESDQEKD